ncbi:uncharacterized protein LOC113305589 [Papaver somniferum]|uniref:uncharacterized protein LOC113305589 n=1 Tax=Papaver somniferum TaxID=3469 RepID=UPI000E704B72|nr:uncharacterized protein LOC113305589 [Papaver somniferum]
MSPGDNATAKPKGVKKSNDMPNIDDELFVVPYSNVTTHPGHKITLLTGSKNEGAAPSASPARVMRFFLRKNEYPASLVNFKVCHTPLSSYEGWMRHMLSNERIRNNLAKAQIVEAVMASATLHIRKYVAGLIAFTSRWCPSTHTNLCRWGEMTITLESVSVLLSLPITGSFDYELSTAETTTIDALIRKAEGYNQQECGEKCFYTWWVSEWFPTKPKLGQVLDDELSVVTFLSLWLSRDVFDDGSGKKTIRRELVMFAIRLAQGVVLPLGRLFLGSLYFHLDSLVADMYASNGYKKVESHIHVAFLQAFLWEHFKGYAPVTATSFSSLCGGSRILRWQKRRPKPGLRLIDFFDNMYAIDFRPWGPVHSFVVQPKTFAVVSDTVLHTDGKNMGPEEIIFMRSCMPGYIPSFFDESLIAIPYNIDRAARQMGFDQGIPFCRPPMPSGDLLPSVLDASIFPSKQSLPFLLSGRKPVATNKYKDFWRKELLVPRDRPSSEILKQHKRLKPLPGKRTKADASDDCSPQEKETTHKRQGLGGENAFTKLARSRHTFLEKYGDSEPLEDGDEAKGKEGSRSDIDRRSVSQYKKEPNRCGELEDATVTETNLELEGVDDARNTVCATSMVAEVLPSKEPSATNKDVFVKYEFNASWFCEGFSEIQRLQGEISEVSSMDYIAFQEEDIERLSKELKLKQASLQKMKAVISQKNELLLKDFP